MPDGVVESEREHLQTPVAVHSHGESIGQHLATQRTPIPPRGIEALPEFEHVCIAAARQQVQLAVPVHRHRQAAVENPVRDFLVAHAIPARNRAAG